MAPILNVKLRRLQQQLSQAGLAELAGLTQPEVSLIEAGRLIPTPEQLERLAGVLSVPSAALLAEVTVRDEVPA